MSQNPLNHGAFINQRDYPHLARTSRALQRVSLPDLLDQFTPLRRRNAAGLVLRDIDHLDGMDRPGLGLRGGLLIALAARRLEAGGCRL